MKPLERLKQFLGKYFFNRKWRCVLCGDEVFEGENFCSVCEKTLPYNDGIICEHCGRKVIAPEKYCLSCKNVLTDIDKGRSVFVYEPPISALIKKMKYRNGRFLADVFSEYLAALYAENTFDADLITFIPMTDAEKKERGFNQSQLLAEKTAERLDLPVVETLVKKAETKRQARLGRVERLKNLGDAFRVKSAKAIRGKKVMIIDDVTTTGATAQAAAERLKRRGAAKVYLITAASTPPMDKY